MTDTDELKKAVQNIPRLKNVKPAITRSADSDGKLIFEFLLMNHGFLLERFINLHINQRDYIESTLYVIIRHLLNHLELLGKLK